MDIKKYILNQSYRDNWEIYQKTLEKSYLAPKWDIIVITASNESQANAYRLQINSRKENGTLPDETEFIIIADPEDKRVGSGGSTINVLYKLHEKLKEINHDENPFKNQRIAIIHSGGDSKRLPQYSAFGKLFSKVPRQLPDGRYSTLFDEFIISLSGIPSRMQDGVFIASGDALLVFNFNQIDLGRQGAAGISIKEPAEMGTRHGVFVQGESQKVRSFLHKMPLNVLEEKGAVDADNNVNIDTGMVWFDSEIALKLTDLILTEGNLDSSKFALYVNEKIRLNFYGDFIIPLTENSIEEDYYKEPTEGFYCDELIAARKGIWNALKGYSMYLQILSPAEFIHFGTTKEFRDIIVEFNKDYEYLQWQNEVVSFNKASKNESSSSLINSYAAQTVEAAGAIFIEDSILKAKCRLGSGAVLSNIYIENTDLNIEDNVVVHQLPVNNAGEKKGYITRVYGVYDNPKLGLEDKTPLFLNHDFKKFIEDAGIPYDLLWNEGDTKDLWNAKLYPLCSDREESIAKSLLLQKIGALTQEQKNEWLASRRFSLKESYQIADQTEILKYQYQIEDYIRVECFCEQVKNGKWVQEVISVLGNTAKDIHRRIELLLSKAEKEDEALSRVRLYRAAAEAVKKHAHSDKNSSGNILKSWREYENIAYNELRLAIQDSVISKEYKPFKIAGESAVVEAYARVNFGGGWSDTPPYSLEMGGTVLNASIILNGVAPIKVQADRLSEPVIVCESKDLDIAVSFSKMEDLLRYNDPTNPLALHKAALFAAGILPVNFAENHKTSLQDILNYIGGGIKIRTEVNIPKGSGLGTSSILAGAVLKALNQLVGKDISEAELFEQVLYLEQLLTTGGGWQDQVGGLVPGIKLITTKPGIRQVINYEMVKLDDKTMSALNDRFVLLYTGQRRLAKGILRDIMGDYLLNNPTKLKHLYEIQRIAVLMKFELRKGNLDAFAELMNEHLVSNKMIDPGCTNSYIDQIIEICRPYISGVKMCGAGGGGFVQMLLKDGEHKAGLNRLLNDTFKGNYVGLWDGRIEGF